jgi:Holliday junction resolvasome RuvABC ATP-dependent DNA helicase subunit
MQRTLVFLYKRGKRTNKAAGTTTYQASVATIATAIGKSRDVKAIALRVEPYLIERGYLQVGHGGRSLTDAGLTRAKELAKAGVR